MSAPIKITDLLDASNTDELAGFTWELGEVQYQPTAKGSKISLGDAPHVKVTNVERFEGMFPGVILAALNGTSVKVACQAVTRRMKLKDRQAGEESMKVAVLNSLRGIKNRASVVIKTVIRAFGRVFETEEAYMEFGTAFLAAKGLDDETIAEILQGAAEKEEIEEEVAE
jgi:hypothetical protein